MRDFGGALPSKHILGTYEIFEEIGRGGMGIVYRALDLSLDRVVAIKVLRDDLRAQPQIVARFGREARAAASLDHPNIVQIYSVGSDDRVPYIAMEFIEAMPLCVVTQQAKQVPWSLALEITTQVAAALDCAHAAHIIHRDIKPSNILVTQAGKAFITDFGIAKILTVEDGLTIDGSRLGTPHYMSPERCANGELTASSDFYSLGVVLFQMVTGRLPHEGATSVELIHKIIAEPPARARVYAPAIPEGIEYLVAWLLEKNPKHRPRNGAAVIEAICRVREGRPLDTRDLSVAAGLAEFRGALGKEDTKGNTSKSGLNVSGNPRANSFGGAGRLFRGLAIAAALVVVLCAALRYWDARNASDISSQPLEHMQSNPSSWFAPGTLCTFSSEAPGVWLAHFELPNYSVAAVTWMGKPFAAAVELVQSSKTLQEGRRVWCGLNPFARHAWIGIPNRSTLHNTVSPRALDASAFSPSIDSQAPLSGRSLVRVGISSAEGSGPKPALYLWPMDGRADGSGEDSADELLWNEPVAVDRITTSAIAPSGHSLVVALHDENGSELVSADIAADASGHVTRHLPVGAASVSKLLISQDGRWIVFETGTANSKFAVWIVPAQGASGEAKHLCDEAAPMTGNAISPDSLWLAVTQLGPDGKSESLATISLDGSQPQVNLGIGSRPMWLPSGKGIIASVPDRRNHLQLTRIDVGDGQTRTQLTSLEAGVQPAGALSGDGNWAIVALDRAEAPTVALVALSAQNP